MKRFIHMWQHPARVLAYGFGSGFAPKAPGTFGSLVGLALGCLLVQSTSKMMGAIILVICFAVGVWACDVVGKELGSADDGSIVWDEVVAMMLVVRCVGCASWSVFVAFALFRLFDIKKPPPISYFDQRLKHGFGVMFDDLLAALYTVLAFQLVFVWRPF